jgi:hypothetical protein
LAPFGREGDQARTAQSARRFLCWSQPCGLHVKLARNFEFEIRPAGIPVENHFMPGAYSDFDQGGFVGSEIIRNLNLWIPERPRKSRPTRIATGNGGWSCQTTSDLN